MAKAEVTYFTCLKMLSETLAKMPIKYYQKTDKGIIEAEATDTSKLLSKRPNPFMTPTTFWNTVEINRNHYGNGYVYMRKKFDRKKFGGEIKIVDLWVMQSNCVQIVVDDAGIFAGVGRLWYVYTDPTSGRQYVFSTDEVMHFKTSFSFDGITGLPVQQILRDTVAGASESQAFMNNLYESGLTAKATLEYTGELNETCTWIGLGVLIQKFYLRHFRVINIILLSTGSKMTNGLFHGCLSFGWKQQELRPLGQPISRKREHKKQSIANVAMFCFFCLC